jgi:16S rRNA U516 pseudouridylate synthase RsuA-like enzyme
VVELHRSTLGPLTLDGLPVGEWRLLAQEEVGRLRDAMRRMADG